MSNCDSKPTIVVDLDDTLVHVTPVVPYDLENGNFFTIVINRRKFYVQMRPYLQNFLDNLSRFYNICVFTASEQKYANKIIDKILPNVNKCYRFFRDSCINMCGYFVKDLDIIDCPLHKTLLIDDTAGSALKNPKNLVRIKPWNGEKDDDVLKHLIVILEKIAYEIDLGEAFIETVKNGSFDGIDTF